MLNMTYAAHDKLIKLESSFSRPSTLYVDDREVANGQSFVSSGYQTIRFEQASGRLIDFPSGPITLTLEDTQQSVLVVSVFLCRTGGSSHCHLQIEEGVPILPEP